jgi:hypothetical protein
LSDRGAAADGGELILFKKTDRFEEKQHNI